MSERDKFLKAVDGLRMSFDALDRKLGRLSEQVTALAHEVETLKRQQQPVFAVSTYGHLTGGSTR